MSSITYLKESWGFGSVFERKKSLLITWQVSYAEKKVTFFIYFL